MTSGLVSIIVPSRNETFLAPTVRDLLTNATGPIEVIVVLDGYWPNPALPADPRLHIIHKGRAEGMRPAINSASRIARGQYLMKIDAHCAVAQGYDETLKANCDTDWIVVPRRHRLEPQAWRIEDGGKPPIDAHYLSYPYERPADPSCGLHGTVWTARAAARLDHQLDDEMSSQGSCWFMTRAHWNRLGEMEVAKYGNFIQEFQELGLKTWLRGGAVKVNKSTWYAHLHKGRTYGRGYFISKQEMATGADFATRYWMSNSDSQATRSMRWLVEHFAPVPGWPTDLSEVPGW